MKSDPAESGPLAVAPKARTEAPGVVVAVEPAELKLFFHGPTGGPERLGHLLPTARFAGARADRADWNEWLRLDPPAIIVSCWSTLPIPADLPGLRYVCHLGGSVRRAVPRALLERGILVSNWGDNASEGLAEAALLLALSALRRSHFFGDQMHRVRGWNSAPSGTRTLYDRQVGIHGFGAGARRLVALLAPFRAKISAYSANAPDELFREDGVERCASLDALFARSEVLFEMEALTPATEGSVTEARLRLLPPGATFVNVARGALVDEDAAARLAAEGRIRLALDVYRREPLPSDSPLRDLPEVTLFPHVASPTEDRMYRCGDHALANLGRYLRGEPVAAQVSLESYDRST